MTIDSLAWAMPADICIFNRVNKIVLKMKEILDFRALT